ncbi:hypothetical protein [Sphingomonas sp.]|uniref:hypothetical protein n=2 Tax=Sphingomonas TaxID=13687 RepID=UPI0035B3704B
MSGWLESARNYAMPSRLVDFEKVIGPCLGSTAYTLSPREVGRLGRLGLQARSEWLKAAQLRTSTAAGMGRQYMRTILCLLLGIVAAAFALIGTTMPLMLPAQAAKDRAYYQQFRVAAAYIDRNGALPEGEALRRFEDATSGPSIWSSLNTTPLDCDPSFRKAPTDRLILSFWRGEWSECYAYPSGQTTLPMSVRAYLISGVGLNLVIYWLIAAVAAWGAIRLRPRRRASSVPSVS